MKRLYGLFTSKQDLENTITRVSKVTDRIYILNLRDSEELIFTFNSTTFLQGSILLHKKKETQTLFSINGLNALVEELNGTLDPKYAINWNNYRNSLITTQGYRSKVTRTSIHQIITV